MDFPAADVDYNFIKCSMELVADEYTNETDEQD